MARTANPEALTGRLYLPNGDMRTMPYIPSRDDDRLMGVALDEARKARNEGNPAVGAVILTQQGEYPAHSTELTDEDLRNHAEMNAYGMAQSELGLDMSDSMWFTTVEPCGMCLSPIVQGKVGTLFYAADRKDAPEFFRQKNIVLDTMLRDAGHTILVVAGLRRAESMELLTGENKLHKSNVTAT